MKAINKYEKVFFNGTSAFLYNALHGNIYRIVNSGNSLITNKINERSKSSRHQHLLLKEDEIIELKLQQECTNRYLNPNALYIIINNEDNDITIIEAALLHVKQKKVIKEQNVFIIFFKKPNSLYFEKLISILQNSFPVHVTVLINPTIIDDTFVGIINKYKSIHSMIGILDVKFDTYSVFTDYLETVYRSIRPIYQANRSVSLMYNIRNKEFYTIDEFFYFFLSKGALRYDIKKICLNPVLDNYDPNKNPGIFCFADYELYIRILEKILKEEKYCLLNITGGGIIPKLQQYLFDKKYIRPSVLNCSTVFKSVIFADSINVYNCFNRSLVSMIKRQKCEDCCIKYLCGNQCLSNLNCKCPPVNKIFETLFKGRK